ncbi:MAG: D-alanyl-D-alanine dipeptidase [bacterium]|nr:D-alanyl-D-alanine dipeptidase [candidate division KSB1 bacterium]MDH7559590.1 D-alanyl-D-alanine dipeptidase [bacterium]
MARRPSLLVGLLLGGLLIGFCATPPADLVDIRSLDSTIVVDLKYATADNFVGDTLYAANVCFLRQATAERLVRVQRRLRQAGLGVKVYDCYRPLSVQWRMWELVPDTRYVADPRKGSRHNRGAAVDLTLVDSSGQELLMPSAFDDFTERASRSFTGASPEALRHRALLEEAMTAEGFLPLPSEWWHFDDPEWQRYPVLDIPLEKLQERPAK